MPEFDGDVIVIGAGIVGAACARTLARRGRRVALVDRAGPAAGATRRAMGHVHLMDENEPLWELTRYAQRCWEALAGELPAETDRRVCGTLWLATEADRSAAERKASFAAAHGLRCDLLEKDELHRLEPVLADAAITISCAVLVPPDSVVFPLDVCRWLADEAVRAGAWLLCGASVARVRAEEGEVLLENGLRLRATDVVVACGAWSAEVVPSVSVRKRKGHLVLTEPAPGLFQHQLVELGYLRSVHASAPDSVALNVQMRRGGQVLVGSSRQFGCEDEAVDPAILERMLERAFEFVPALRRVRRVDAWTGFRPSTPDGMPLIGRCSGREGLWLATGHEGIGITSGVATAELLADLMDGQAPAIDMSPFDPARCQQATPALADRS